MNISPEMFVARYGHREMCNSSDEYHYRNIKFQEWIYKYLGIMRDPKVCLDDIRSKYLTEEELAKIKQEKNAGF